MESINLHLDKYDVEISIDRYQPYDEPAHARWCDIWFYLNSEEVNETVGGEELCSNEADIIYQYITDILNGVNRTDSYRTIEPYYELRESREEDCLMEWIIPKRDLSGKYKYDGSRILRFKRKDLEILQAYLGEITNHRMDILSKGKEIIKAGILGTVVGDALGVPVEFSSREERKIDPVADMREYGTHSQPKGTWSDDSSMMLATMDSMVVRGGVRYDDIMAKFVMWRKHGDYTPYGNVFDVGITCDRAITNFRYGSDPTECGGTGERDNGNGSLMRIMPIALFEAMNPDYWNEEMYYYNIEEVQDVSRLTHGHPRSQMACVIYASICHELIFRNGRSIEEAVQYAISRTLENYSAAWEAQSWFDTDFYDEINADKFKRLRNIAEFKNLSVDEIRSSGYVVDTLEAAIWCLLNTKSYKECTLKAVNLGDDTDTVGAVAGGIAGLAFGYDNIPSDWLSVIASKEWIEVLCEDFHKMLSDY